MTLSVAELVKRIEQGEDLESISRSLVSPAERALLKCCAIVRTFDESLVDNYFQKHIPNPETVPFSKLITRDFVQRVPRSDGVYFLQANIQKQYYDAWWESDEGVLELPKSEVPPALRELSLNLVDYYASQRENAKLDLLAQLVFVNKYEACSLFEELYQAADDGFDLAGCRDIINVLKGRENVLGATFSTLLNDKDRYLQSRTLWATEYYQTVNYYERKEVKDELESFFTQGNKIDDPNRKWILHLHGPGGMGKTMFLRWLISRRCVPEPYTIPCARVDFDFVDRITSSEHRWRLFLDMARDLEVQIPGNFFHSLITRFTEYENILSHAELQQTDSPTPAQLPPLAKLQEEILYLFGTAIKGKPNILIFDTLEEVILYRPDDLLELVRQVDTVRKLAPEVLLILSGRYDLTEKGAATRLPSFVHEFGSFTQTVQVKPFAKDEALGFLKEKKKLTADRPLDIVVERSEGNPFKLALFADILLDDPTITEQKIRDYPRVDLLYLIERVLARIPNKKLHWLLRYGVVPRKLTRTFAEDVIKKHLLLRIAGDSSQDDPSRYESLTEKIHATVKQKKIFEVHSSSEQEINMAELWAELQNYASSYAWVTTESSDPNAVVFHGDVVNPMRRWLEDEPVYQLLHQDGISYFENKAQTDPNNRVKWLCNAVYHKFQLEGAEAAAYWQSVLVNETNPRGRRELAREILGSEYVDENFKPRQLRKKGEIVRVSTLVEAYYELALSAVEIARGENLGASNPLWSEADFDLQKCEELQRGSGKEVISAGDIASLRAAILISQGRSEEATKIVEKALESHMSDHQRMRLKIELASAYATLGNNQQAERYWKESLLLAKRTKSSTGVSVSIYRMLARLHRNQGNLEVSAQELETALHNVESTDLGTSHHLLVELADVYFEMGRLSQSKKTIEEAQILNKSVTIVDQLQYWNHHAKFSLLAGNPQTALETSQTAMRALLGVEGRYSETGESQDVFDSLIIESQEQLGMAHRQLFAIEEAREAFELARSRWREIGNSKAAQRCMLKKADMWLSVVGDIKEAASTLNEAARLTIQYDAEQSLETGLLSIRQCYLALEEGMLKSAIDTLEKQAIERVWNDKLKARLILGIGPYRLLPDDPKSANKFFAEVAEKLRRVAPVSARIFLLDPLKDYPTCKKLDRKLVDELISLVPLDKNDDDFMIHAPKVAELLRVLGRKHQSLASLDELFPFRKTFVERDVLMIRSKTSFVDESADLLKSFVDDFLKEFDPYPTLCGSTLVEFAELPYTTRSSSVRLKLLEQAEALLQRESARSHWMARLIAAQGKLTIKRDREKALEQIMRAISAYEYFGNNRAIADLNNFIARHEPKPQVVASSDEVPGVVEIPQSDIPRARYSEPRSISVYVPDNWTEAVEIRSIISDDDVFYRKVPIEPGSLLDQMLAFDTYENYSFRLLREMDQNWIRTCTQMGQILIDDVVARQFMAESHGIALRLMIDALQLSSPPWEMMVMPSKSDHPASLVPGVTYLYRTLGQQLTRNPSDILWMQDALSRFSKERLRADGIVGPKTTRAIVNFQRQHKLPAHGVFDGRTRRKLKQVLCSASNESRPRVLLLRPGIERQRASSRGRELFGFSTVDNYRSEKFSDLKVVEDPNVKEVERHVFGFKPDVIHILSTVEESTSIGIFLDFATGGTGVFPEQTKRGDKSSTRARGASRPGSVDFLTISNFAEIVAKYQKPDNARPLLILDVLEPPGRTDLFTQLFLRNAFATQLFQHGGFESIIAAGLTPHHMQSRISSTLVSGLAQYESVGDIVNRMRRVADLGNYTRLPDIDGRSGPLNDPSDRDYLSIVVATAGISLFTQDPEM